MEETTSYPGGEFHNVGYFEEDQSLKKNLEGINSESILRHDI
jgi:hypothetical protein